MITLILTLLRAHSALRRYLIWKDLGGVPSKDVNIQKDWLRPYIEEERVGIALLQRLHRLRISISRLESEIESVETKAQTPVHGQGLAPPAYTESEGPSAQTQAPVPQPAKLQSPSQLELQKLRGQLKETSHQLYLHQKRIRSQWKNRPVGGSLIREFDLVRRVTISGGQPLIWADGVLACALSGGCCGRRCGCCEKPLESFLLPTRDWKSQKIKLGIYGHCSEECGCCIERKGTAYAPEFVV